MNEAKQTNQTGAHHAQPMPQPLPPVQMYRPPAKPVYGLIVKTVRVIATWVLIASVAVFAFVALLAIWNFFGSSTGEIWWKSAVSIFTIGMGALIVTLVAPLLDKNR